MFQKKKLNGKNVHMIFVKANSPPPPDFLVIPFYLEMLYHGLQQMKWNVYVNKLTIEVAHCKLKPLEI